MDKSESEHCNLGWLQLEMAAILHQSTVISGGSEQSFVKLKSNPMFSALRDTLLSDVQQTSTVPETLIKVEADNTTDDDTCNSLDPSIVAVQEANLMSDFQQILPLGNKKVTELQEFYKSQCCSIENDRNESIQELKENNMLSVSQYQKALNRLHVHHDQQRMHLTNRVTASLHLLKMSMPSSCEVSSSKARSRQLNPCAVEIMTDWFDKHIDSPYPTDEEKQALADLGGLSLSQVKAWFANKRNRTNNTKPKKQKQHVENRLLSICTELSTDNGQTRPRMYGDIIKQLSDIVNSAPVFSQTQERLADAYNSSGDELENFYSDWYDIRMLDRDWELSFNVSENEKQIRSKASFMLCH